MAVFPTILHKDTAESVRDYFIHIPCVDTVLLVNSCARARAVPESDLDFAILVNSTATPVEIMTIESDWGAYAQTQPAIAKYKQSGPYAHLHLDIITGQYAPKILESGEPLDYFEIEIGNQICYSLPMDFAGPYFQELQKKWLPYYSEDLRKQRLVMSRNVCIYDLDHIPFFIKRGLYFQAFDILYKAFQEYLQTLFISKKTYPIAYNKWIKEQVVEWLDMPGLYPKLLTILSIGNIEGNEIIDKAELLRGLLDDLAQESQ